MNGPLGVGKTTLTKALGKVLGIKEPITSPTFSLVQEYEMNVNGLDLPFFHMDLYRLAGEEEFELIGGWEYLNQGSICLIEWSERLSDWPSECISLYLEFENDHRVVKWEGSRP
jgi:tRNA threonylcarbamoyladenosine biosynthesis protein TsaE